MAASVRIEFNLTEVKAKLDLVEGAMAKLDVLKAAMVDALNPTATAAAELVPQPGKAGYTPRRGRRKGMPHLRSQMRAIARIYPRRKFIVGVAGPQYKSSRGGNHGHLVEDGHRLVLGGTTERVGRWKEKGTPNAKKARRTGAGRIAGQVEGRPFLAPAAARTRANAQKQFAASVAKFVDDSLRGMGDG
jgi:hypothetical protein